MIAQRLLRRSWPSRPIDLLLTAILAPPDQARAAWREWTATRVFEDAGPGETRLLAPLAKRMALLDPESPLRPRIEGLAKQTWTHAQMTLREAADALDLLRGAGIAHLVFKGGAHYAEGLGAATRRMFSDLDLLVAPQDCVAAIEVLTRGGWQANRGDSPALLKRLAAIQLSTNFRKGRFGEIDLHRHLFHYSAKAPEEAAALWRRARPATLAGRPVLVPDPTDGLVISLAHGARSGAGDWAIDIVARLREQGVDWDRFLAAVATWHLAPAARSGLHYVRERLGVAVPDEVLTQLDRLPVTPGEWMKYWANAREGEGRSWLVRNVERLGDRLLPLDRYERRSSGRRAIAVARSRFLPRLPGRPLPLPGSGFAVRQGLLLDAAAGSRLFLRCEIERPARRRRVHFDVTLDGVAVARLRTRSGGGKRAGKPQRLTFSFRLPLSGRDLVIEARPNGIVTADTSAAQRAAEAPVAFRLLRAHLHKRP